MPFGLKNAFGIFQHTMEVILSSIEWQFAIVYLDDIMIFGKRKDTQKTFRPHLQSSLSPMQFQSHS